MKIDTAAILNMPGITSQNGMQANGGPDLSKQANNSSTASNQANSQAKANPLPSQKQEPGNADASSGPAPSGITGGLALDEDKNVVVRFWDDKGNVVAQYPPEDYLKMMKEFKKVTENLFHTIA